MSPSDASAIACEIAAARSTSLDTRPDAEAGTPASTSSTIAAGSSVRGLSEVTITRSAWAHAAAAIRGGMTTLVEDGKKKILRGVTTPLEVARFAQAEVLLAENIDI